MQRLGLILSLWIMVPPAFADLPLTVESLIANPNTFKINTSFSYTNHEQQQVVAGGYQLIPAGPTSFILVPTVFGQTTVNSDTFVLTLGLHYGLTHDLEISVRGSQLHRETRSGTTFKQESHFVNSWVGMHYRISPDGETPALFGFWEVALQEKDPAHPDVSSGQSYSLGLTTYRAIDPTVLSLTAIAQFHQPRERGMQQYQPGNFLILNPAVGFAANDTVSLTGGVQWQARQPSKLEGEPQGLTRTRTQLTLGVGYGFSKQSTLNTTVVTSISGSSGATLNVSWSYGFS